MTGGSRGASKNKAPDRTSVSIIYIYIYTSALYYIIVPSTRPSRLSILHYDIMLHYIMLCYITIFDISLY